MVSCELEVAREAAYEAGEVLRSKLNNLQNVEFKGDRDMVTEADKESERVVLRILRKEFPDYSILAEESGMVDAQIADSGRCSQMMWIVDPLDGTTNYAHGLPEFAVSIGLARDGVPVLGVVYNPIRDEMFWGKRGGGAYLNESQISVSGVMQIERSLLSTGFPYDIADSDADNLDHFRTFSKRAQAVRSFGSAALDLCRVACGRQDGFWEYELKPWDTAAGVVLVEEAGGKITDFWGGPWSIEGDSIVASNPLIHAEMIDLLSRGKTGLGGVR